jgi:protein TonB
MYESVQHTSNSTRAIGASIAAAIVAVVGVGATIGVVQNIVAAEEKPMEVVLLAPEVSEPLEPVQPEVSPDVELAPAELTVPLPEFEFEAASEAPVAAVVDTPVAATPTPAVAPPSGTGRVAPKLRADSKPPYPAASLRAQEQGTTSLEVCVDANGRVSSASVVQSSGFVRLDEAAAKWIRTQRFTPGSVGGVAQSMCGHKVDNVWDVEDAR